MNNLQAFLKMIWHSEGTSGRVDASGVPIDPYRICFGYHHVIIDLSDHPAVTGEWHGESLAELGPEYTNLVSTAAGAYQLIKPTWLRLKARLNLPNFGPASQDAAATSLIREKGALDLVNGGQVADAIQLCHGEWASLPGSNVAGQPQAKMADLIQAYTGFGGAYA